MDTNTESVAAAVIAAGIAKETELKAKAAEVIVVTEAKAVEGAITSEAKKVEQVVETKAESVATEVKVEAVKVAEEVKSKVLTTAEHIAALIKTHVEALNVARASIEEANKLIVAAKGDYQKVKDDAEKAKHEAELFVAATGGVFKHIFTKIRSWF